MKIKKFWEKEDKIMLINHCKICGCELASGNKDSLCINCKLKKKDKAKKVAGAAVGVVGTVVLFIAKKAVKVIKK